MSNVDMLVSTVCARHSKNLESTRPAKQQQLSHEGSSAMVCLWML